MLKRVFKGLGLALLILVAILAVNTWRYQPQNTSYESVALPTVDTSALAQQLSTAITFQTISARTFPDGRPADFQNFVDWLPTAFPTATSAMERTLINDLTPLYMWRGSDPSLKPILLTAHYDVVPVEDDTGARWTYPPFEGRIADGIVWGRGAMDDKGALIAMLAAVELLINDGFKPKRSIYFSFGHDEETGGTAGAAGVAQYLKAQGVQLAWSLDEGSFVAEGLMPGVSSPVALVNVAEKGSVTLELIAHGPGGHSSMPEAELAVDILAKALVNLRKQPLPGGIEGVTAESFDILAPHLPFGLRVLMANRWLFGPLLESQLSKDARIDALMRTTTAPTMLQAGIKSNVIPPTATAIVNFRLHPRDTAEGVVAHVISAIDDERVDVGITGDGLSSPASGVSSRNSDGYQTISRVTRQIYGDVIVAPGMTMGGTDSKHYGKVSDDTYRINLMKITPADISGFHGKNERIAIDNLVSATGAYYLLIKEAAGAG